MVNDQFQAAAGQIYDQVAAFGTDIRAQAVARKASNPNQGNDRYAGSNAVETYMVVEFVPVPSVSPSQQSSLTFFFW